QMYVCECTEFTKWQTEDKHSTAYAALTYPRSKEMGRLLWNDEDVTKRKECLSCHAVALTPADRKDPSFQLEQGGPCVICHGPREEWIDAHSAFRKRPKWRALTPAEKEKQYGLADLWTPSKRAALCASCHVGRIQQGEPDKFVTHEMYAAGHPPLPSFEAATF